jgi:kynurenine aminotransferase
MTSSKSDSQGGGSQGALSRWETRRADRIHEELNQGVDVWTLFNPAVFPTAINLGQGFMNWSPPSYILDSLTKELNSRVDLHHYSHPSGRLRLRQAISAFYSSQFHLPSGPREDALSQRPAGELPRQRPLNDGRKLDVETEIQVTSGANGGIYSVMGAFINQGDKVVCIEPFFDQYNAEILFHGGIPTYSPLIPPPSADGKSQSSDWTIDMSHLEQLFADPATKVLILNTPHNPVGKVFSLAELQEIAALCVKYDILVVSDEVYDCLTFDGHEHVRIASLEGMWDRTITVGSAGKSFACTGWRVGWLVGPRHLVGPSRVVHTRITFSVNSGAQEGAAIGLERAEAEGFFARQTEEYVARRAALQAALTSIGLPHTTPHGSYFVMADASRIRIPPEWPAANKVPPAILAKPRDYLIAYFIAKICDVVAIPATAFYSSENAALGENFIRFSFCKDGQIEIAAQRLQKLVPYLGAN